MIDITTQPEEPVVANPLDISVGSTAPITPLSPKDLEKRAVKYHIALNEASPGIPEIEKLLLLPNGDDAVRDIAVTSEKNKKRETIAQLYEQETTADVADLDALAAEARKPVPREALLEKLYAERVISTGIALTNNPKETAEGADDPYSQIMHDYLVEQQAKKEGLERIYENRAAFNKSQDWGTTVWNFAEQLVPMWSSTSQINDDLGEKFSSTLPGANKQEQFQYIASLSAEEAVALVKQIDENMSASNPLEAEQWLSDLTGYYGSTDADIESAFAILDVAGLPGVGFARKLATKTVLKIASETSRLRKSQKATQALTKTGEKTAEGGRNLNQVPARGVPAKGVVEAGKVPTKETREALEKRFPGRDPRSAYLNRLERMGAVLAQKGAEPQDILAGIGHLDESVKLRALDLAKKALPNDSITRQEGIASLFARTSSLSNPGQWAIDTMKAGITKAAEVRDLMITNADLFTRMVSGVANVSRLPDKLYEQIFDAAEKVWKADAKQAGLEKAMLTAIQRYRADSGGLNIGYLDVKFGKKDGTLFADAQTAGNTAKTKYGFVDGTYTITQEGDGYAVHVSRDIDETSEFVRQALIGGDNVSNAAYNKIFGVIPTFSKGVHSAKDTVSKFQREQRGILSHATSLNEAFASKMFAAIKDLGKREQKALSKVMQVNRTSGDPAHPGKFFDNLAEFEMAYVQYNGRFPTDVETKAYVTFVQQSDMDYIFRAVAELKKKARQGVERMEADLVNGKKLQFEGKTVDHLPFQKEHDAGVYWNIEKGGYKRLSEPGLADLLKKRGKELELKFVHVFNPDDAKISETLGVSGSVNFIVTAGDLKKGALRFDEQLPYQPGFHIRYDEPWYGKQGKISYDSAGRRVYHGDTVAFGANSEAKGKEMMSLLEQARLAVKSKDDKAIEAVIAKGFPHTLEETKKLFKDTFDVNTPFSLVRNGVSAADNSVVSATGKSLRDELGDFEDFSNSPFNLARQQGADYLGNKNGPLKTWVKDGASQGNPVWKIEDASMLDPMQTQTQAMGRLIRDRHFQDYQITAAESFVREFADMITLDGNKVLSPQELSRNPLYYLLNGKLKLNPDGRGLLESRYGTARQSQIAIQNLLRHKSWTNTSLAWMRDKLLSEAYKLRGDKFVQTVDDWTAMIATDIPTKMRALAFHTKMGIWNIVQAPLQLVTLAQVSAMNPRHGPSAAYVGFAMRKLDLLPGDDAAARQLAKYVSKITPGWTEHEFVESYNMLKRTGFDILKGDMAWKNDLTDYKLFKGKVGTFLDWGTSPYIWADRLTRLGAWNTAYKDYVTKFPKTLGKMTDTDAKAILDKADDYSVNMTRQGHAVWQEGAASLATQFWGYQARLFDLMTGLRLSKGEKARLVMWNSMMFGAPIGVGMNLPIWPWENEVRQMLFENNVDPNSGITDVLMNGIPAASLSALSSAMGWDDVQLNIGGRWGPGSIQALYQLFQTRRGETGFDDLIKVLGGASGTIALEIGKSMYTIAGDLSRLVATGDGERILYADVLNAAKTISTFNNTERALIAYRLGVYRSKNLRVIDPAYSAVEGVFHGLTGIDPQSVQDTFVLSNSIEDEKSTRYKAGQELKKWLRAWKQARFEGDEEGAEEFLMKAKSWAIAAGHLPEEVLNMTGDILGEKSLSDTLSTDFINQPKETSDENARRELLGK